MQDENYFINSRSYWDMRFSSGDWERKGGYSQTKLFAESQINYYSFDADFSGSICDFGCGAGDAFPVYRKNFPNAKLLGVDFSKDAIELCIKRYGDIANFYQSESKNIPYSDVIICSNVLEHIDDDVVVVNNLLHRCKILYVIVPYKESPLSTEHVRQYDENAFQDFRPISKKIFLSKGWSKFGLNLWYQIYLKNIARLILGRSLLHQARQIIFKFNGVW